MTNLRDRPNTVLLVVDVQNDVVANAYHRDEVVANIRELIGRARACQVPVLWVQHSDDNLPEGSDGWKYVPELQRHESEPLVRKNYGDAFEDTVLESELIERRVGRLVVTGAQTDACIRATLHGAFTRGYRSWLPTRTPRRTSPNTDCRRPTRSSRIPTCTGPGSPARVVRPAWSRQPTSTSTRWSRCRRSDARIYGLSGTPGPGAGGQRDLLAAGG